MQIRNDIQIIRGFAVISVVLFHLQIPLFKNGFLGVDIFFVISGFLMAKLYDKSSTIEFYKRRLNRLFPAYATTIFLTIISGYFILTPIDFNQLSEQSFAGIFFISNIYYWNQNSYFDKTAFNPLLNLWSLASEIQFYLIVPFLYPAIRSKKWLFTAIFLISITICFTIQTISPKTSFFMMPMRIWEFLIGAWVAWQNKNNFAENYRFRKYIQLALTTLFISTPFYININPDAIGSITNGHPAIPSLIITLLTGLAIKYEIPTFIVDSIAGKILTKIGDYSYSIYLTHFPIIVLFNYIPFEGTKLSLDSYRDASLVIFLIFTSSLISYFLFEKTFKIIKRKKILYFYSLAIIIISPAILGKLNSNKYSNQEKNIFLAWEDRDIYRCGKLFRIMNPTSYICEIKHFNNGKKILLLGNSHADSIKKSFSETAFDYGYSTYFIVPNDPLIGASLNSSSIISLAEKNSINIIFIHFSNVYKNESAKKEILKTIELAEEKNIEISIISPIPTYDTHIPKTMFENLDRAKSFKIHLSDHYKNTNAYQNFTSQLSKFKVKIYDPAQIMCPAMGECLYENSESKPYYFDSGHLTLTGALLLKPLFKEAIKKLSN